MEIVDFSTKTFKEIPMQDNPAYMTKKEFLESGEHAGCVLITKTPDKSMFIVMRILLVDNPMEEESVQRIGLFWNHNDSLNFARSVVGELFYKSLFNIRKTTEEINALKAEDYKDYKSEDHEEPTEYERGFNAAVGLCLAILDEQ